jgi:hypothetical protein
MATVTERLDKHDKQMALHDKQIAVIRDLLKAGIKLVNSLAASQKRTADNLEALTANMRGGGNGHTKRKI